MITIILLLVLTGLLAGVIAGLMGLGGGILFVPVLLMFFQSAGIENPVLWTVGTSLICNFVAALSSSYKHYQMDNIFLKESLLVGVFGVAGTYVGRLIVTSPHYQEQEFTIFFSLILLYSAYHFFRRKNSDIKTARMVKPMVWYHGLMIGFAAGLLAPLAGVGGGLILIPAMSVVLSYSFKKLVSISSFSIVLITLSGSLQFALISHEMSSYSGFHLGFIDFGVALPLIVSSIFGARYGVKLLANVRLRTLELIFGALLILVILRLIYGLF